MKILLATSNQNKVREIKEFLSDYEIYALSEILEPFEIEENGDSFKQNALIKARAVFQRLNSREWIALSDDSGISVSALNFAPGIFSARYAGIGASDAQNRAKLIAELGRVNLTHSPAFYTACISVASRFGEFSAHGFLHGEVIASERGNSGFGYDFMFVPRGFDKTIAELGPLIKAEISHRGRALGLIKYVLDALRANFGDQIG